MSIGAYNTNLQYAWYKAVDEWIIDFKIGEFNR